MRAHVPSSALQKLGGLHQCTSEWGRVEAELSKEPHSELRASLECTVVLEKESGRGGGAVGPKSKGRGSEDVAVSLLPCLNGSRSDEA